MLERLPDFEAGVTFRPKPDGTSFKKQAGAGWRPDFRYVEDEPSLDGWMIWPIEWSADGRKLEEGETIPQKASASFWILNPDLRIMHQNKIKVGTRFRIVEGRHIIADGGVTKLLNLHEPSNTKES